ncbi:MAG: orotidine 5'-phosphate decarboxylase / HUMPS family protein [Nanoarchaeota archaeon]|nr:orotidine 5'-phosphate decarboxylase / HUMPS family protein [Nanoarchaeota archaeon]
MTQTFTEKWLEAVEKKNSILCAGLDPPEFEERRKLHVPQGINKEEWSIKFIKAVAPYCAAVKPNQKFWDGIEDAKSLAEVLNYARAEGLVIIYDCKAADIGASNDEQFLNADVSHRRFDAVTLACYAGNIKEAAEQLRKRNLGGIHMCLMSNPDYQREKNMLVQIPDEEIDEDEYGLDAEIYIGHKVKRYMQLAHDAKKFGLEGIVVGAPSDKNHIKPEEIEKISHYAGKEMLILCPGIGGKQGGDASVLFRYFPGENIIANVASGLMFPNGPNSTPEEQAIAAKQYMEELNSLRAAA